MFRIWHVAYKATILFLWTHLRDGARWGPAGPRVEALAQAVAEPAVELAVSALDVNALLDRVDINRLLDRVDIDRLLDRVDIGTLVEQTDLGAVIARSSSGVASDALDMVGSQTVGLDEFIARWIGRLRRRPYTGPPGPPDGLQPKAGP